MLREVAKQIREVDRELAGVRRRAASIIFSGQTMAAAKHSVGNIDKYLTGITGLLRLGNTSRRKRDEFKNSITVQNPYCWI